MPDCKTCKESRATVPYIAHEADMARQERTIKKLWILLILVITLLVATNGAWIWYESQWEVVQTEITQDVDTGLGDAFVSGTGDVIYGESAADNTDAIENP